MTEKHLDNIEEMSQKLVEYIAQVSDDEFDYQEKLLWTSCKFILHSLGKRGSVYVSFEGEDLDMRFDYIKACIVSGDLAHGN